MTGERAISGSSTHESMNRPRRSSQATRAGLVPMRPSGDQARRTGLSTTRCRRPASVALADHGHLDPVQRQLRAAALAVLTVVWSTKSSTRARSSLARHHRRALDLRGDLGLGSSAAASTTAVSKVSVYSSANSSVMNRVRGVPVRVQRLVVVGEDRLGGALGRDWRRSAGGRPRPRPGRGRRHPRCRAARAAEPDVEQEHDQQPARPDQRRPRAPPAARRAGPAPSAPACATAASPARGSRPGRRVGRLGARRRRPVGGGGCRAARADSTAGSSGAAGGRRGARRRCGGGGAGPGCWLLIDAQTSLKSSTSHSPSTLTRETCQRQCRSDLLAGRRRAGRRRPPAPRRSRRRSRRRRPAGPRPRRRAPCPSRTAAAARSR